VPDGRACGVRAVCWRSAAPAEEIPDALKRALLGRYTLERELGRGGVTPLLD